jgi:cell division protein FtsW (lipid II flippase)
MIEHMKQHERYVREMLAKNPQQEALQELSEYHDKQIRWMQHERIVHLMVMLFVCLFTLLSLGFAVLRPALPSIALCALLMILTVAYIIHYYRLENGVQRWYALADEIKRRNQP